MSTVMDSVAGTGRNIGVNTWLTILGISVLVFAVNTGVATYRANQLGGAGGAASDLQVLSQQLAVQGQEAVGGDAKAFEEFKGTRGSIQSNINSIREGFGDNPTVSGQITDVVETWQPLGTSADQVSTRARDQADTRGAVSRRSTRRSPAWSSSRAAAPVSTAGARSSKPWPAR